MIKVNGKEIIFDSFPNGELNMQTDSIPLSLINSKKVHMDFKYIGNESLIKLMFMRKYIHPSHKVYLRIWQMPYQRMDRSENGSPFSLKYISEFINDLNFHKVEIIEPHSDVTLALVNNSYPNYINFKLINRVMKEVNFDENLDYIMFPDNGAASRYKTMKFKNVLIGHKDRDFETGEIKKLDLIGDMSKANGRTAIICDDLSSYGGTFNFSSKALRENGIDKVYLLVAHAEDSVFKGKLFENIDGLFTTNSMLTMHTDEDIMEKYKDQLTIYNLEDI